MRMIQRKVLLLKEDGGQGVILEAQAEGSESVAGQQGKTGGRGNMAGKWAGRWWAVVLKLKENRIRFPGKTHKQKVN